MGNERNIFSRLSDLIYRIEVGVRHSPRRLIGLVFFVYSAGWVLLEPLIALVPQLNPHLVGVNRFAILVIASLFAGLILIARPRKVSFIYQNNKISVQFGDLFGQSGFRVIPVSQFMFETDVYPNSLQSQMIQRYTKYKAQEIGSYLITVEEALKNTPFIYVNRTSALGAEKQYSVGTSAAIHWGDEKYCLLALTKTESPNVAIHDNCNVTQLWTALQSLWLNSKSLVRGEDISIPLIGTGVTGIKLSPNQILAINLLALFSAILEGGKITVGEIKIVIHERFFEDIDLGTIKELWKSV